MLIIIIFFLLFSPLVSLVWCLFVEAASRAQLSVQRSYADPIIIPIRHTVALTIITAFTRQISKSHAKDSVHAEVIGLSNYLFHFFFLFPSKKDQHKLMSPFRTVFIFAFFSPSKSESNEIKKQNRLNERQKQYQMKYKTNFDKKSEETVAKVNLK